MTVLTENDLEFDFSTARSAINFDDDALHNPSTLKRVDFISEYDDRIVFLEVKDPDIPGAAKPEAFKTKLLSGNLIPELAGKFRDTQWFRTLSGKATKPTQYIVLIAMSSLDPALLLAKQDELRRSLPLTHREWPEQCASACVIVNLEQYRNLFGADSVRRLSAGA